MINLFFVRTDVVASPGDQRKHLNVTVIDAYDDPRFPGRELGWATSLLPYLVTHHDGEYLLIPQVLACNRAIMAARSLVFQQAATVIGFDIPWAAVASYKPGAEQLQRALPDAACHRYAAFKLSGDFGQALRLAILGSTNALG